MKALVLSLLFKGLLFSVFLDFLSSSFPSTSPPFYGSQFGSSFDDYSTSIWTDSHGNSLLTGNTGGSLFGSSAGAQDIFVSKHHSKNGSIIWGRQFGSPLPDSGIAVTTLHSSEDILVTGYTTGGNSQQRNSTISYLDFSLKYHKAGSYFIKNLCPGDRFIATTLGYYWGAGKRNLQLTLLNSKKAIVAASVSFQLKSSYPSLLQYLHNATCAPFSLKYECVASHKKRCRGRLALIYHHEANTNESLVDGFLTRVESTTGNTSWSVPFGSPSVDVPSAISVCPLDHSVLVAGFTTGSLFVSNHNNTQNLFVMKFNSSGGQLLWGYQSRDASYATSVACDSVDSVYVLYSLLPPYNNPRSLRIMKLSSGGGVTWDQSCCGKNKFRDGVMVIEGSSLYLTSHNNLNYVLYKLNATDGMKIWKVVEQRKLPWSVSVLNSSLYVASTVLRENKNKFHLSKYETESGKKLWGLNYAQIPVGFIPQSYIKAPISINNQNQLRLAGSVSENIFGTTSGGVDVIVLSPNLCSPGNYSTKYVSPCEICPSDTYSTEASQVCHPCAHGYVPNPKNGKCSRCFGGYYTNGRSICFHKTPQTLYYVLTLVFPLSLLTLALLSSSWMNIGFAYTSILSTFDLLSDFLYLATTFFYNSSLFSLAIIFLFPGLIPLFYDFWLKISENKHTLRLFQPLTSIFSRYPKGSFVWIMCMIVWCILAIPYLVITVAIGYYLIQTKLLSLPVYQRLWHTLLFSNEYVPKSSSDLNRDKDQINLDLLNKAVLTEILLEAVPQLVLQTANNIKMKSFGRVAKLSLVISILCVLNSCYRIFYFTLIHGIPISDIPAQVKTPFSIVLSWKAQFEKSIRTISEYINPDEDGIALLCGVDERGNELNIPKVEPLCIHFPSGSTGIVFKVIKDGENRDRVSVFMINKESLGYQSGLRKGYLVETINGAHVDESPIKLPSNYFEEEYSIKFIPPPPDQITVSLPDKIDNFEDIGLSVTLHRSCYPEMSFYEVKSVDEDSVSYKMGVRKGHAIVSVNRACFMSEINMCLFRSPDDPSCCWKSFFNYQDCLSYQASPVIVFQRWSYQEILQNHLRAIFWLIIYTKQGVPSIGPFPFFFTDTLENFGLVNLYILAWGVVLSIQLVWIALWVVYYLIKFPFIILPKIFITLCTQLTFPLDFFQFCFALHLLSALYVNLFIPYWFLPIRYLFIVFPLLCAYCGWITFRVNRGVMVVLCLGVLYMLYMRSYYLMLLSSEWSQITMPHLPFSFQ